MGRTPSFARVIDCRVAYQQTRFVMRSQHRDWNL
jgi:hypothetical protein